MSTTTVRRFKSRRDYLAWLRAAKYHDPGYSEHPQRVEIAGKPYEPERRLSPKHWVHGFVRHVRGRAERVRGHMAATPLGRHAARTRKKLRRYVRS
jgi:hypothetical protein